VFAAGIYLDEIAYDRVTMLRARKVLGDRNVFCVRQCILETEHLPRQARDKHRSRDLKEKACCLQVLGDSGTIDHHSDCGGFTRSPARPQLSTPFLRGRFLITRKKQKKKKKTKNKKNKKNQKTKKKKQEHEIDSFAKTGSGQT
jgi:hypothetical protein